MATSFKKNIWTQHSQLKIKQYGLSKSKLLGILYKPERKELGIVPGTIAVMKTNKLFAKLKPVAPSTKWQKKVPGEIWLMYKDIKGTRTIISAWRYPGISKPGEKIPIPNDIEQEIMSHKFI
ncbi:MAG: hypothetical protein A2904_02230 [Candidatus Staskawiczbacteria bacterium RIFCSPLOWO2_01_FULL_33_9]|uniref:Uncharacterized protein n=1 Tax=Candidatus Staskawiczbacteria bacterium RIFCSPLOWO2_01_FULL_33_9 TaxID=1802211 RepID=A0A1G2I9E4_9BACT|nr:MAG: hypothetical protein A2904_02230 [Candidatus Staskawiczbacteria bacterium RIFCSPLOWO2_01_FULL_33_9]